MRRNNLIIARRSRVVVTPIEPDYWEIEVTTTTNNQSYAFSIFSGTGIDLDVRYDGELVNYTTTGVKSYSFASAGVHLVRFSGGATSDLNIRLGSISGTTPALVTLTRIIGGITGITNFLATFNSCTSLTSIPADLFRYNTAVSTQGFRSTFGSCTSLTSIPTDLFRYNTSVGTEGFRTTFSGCTSLTSIPADLFRYNTSVGTEGFLGTFFGCAGLTSIPADLFRYNTAVSSSGFLEAFRNCTGLTSIPADLFRYNTAVSSSGFLGTFRDCSSLVMRADIFGPDLQAHFEGRTVGFSSFLNRTPNANAAGGTAPALWTVTGWTPTTTNAFRGNNETALTNWNDIPSAWGGPA
jgi:hypothetical protein